MKDVNKIILIGRLGGDPVQRETKAGLPVTQFSLATSRRTRAAEGSEEGGEETMWHRVVAWGKEAEICGQYLKKGNAVYVEGMIRSRKYDAKDGTQRVAYEVHADRVSFLGGRSRVTSSDESEVTAEAV